VPVVLARARPMRSAALGASTAESSRLATKLPVGAATTSVKRAHNRGRIARPAAGDADGVARDARTLLASHHRRHRQRVLLRHLEVAPEADRIGYRSRAQAARIRAREPPFGAGSDPSNITDACYPYGSIQVPEAPSRSCCIVTRSRRRLLHGRHGDFRRHGSESASFSRTQR